MDASSTRRARPRRLALCTGAVLAVAAFTGEARADSGLPGLVSETLSGTVEQLPSPAVEPLAEVVSTVAPTVEAAVPPVVDEVVADATQLPGEVAGPAVPGLIEQAGSSPNERGTGTVPAPTATSTPDAPAQATAAAPIAADPPNASGVGASPKVVRASRPSPAAATPTGTAARSPRPRADATRAPFSQVARVAPIRPVAAIPVADSRPANSSAPSFPAPASSELPGFDALLPPLAAFALLLALPLGFLALTAPSAFGAGLHPAVALLRSADVHFRLVRPG